MSNITKDFPNGNANASNSGNSSGQSAAPQQQPQQQQMQPQQNQMQQQQPQGNDTMQFDTQVEEIRLHLQKAVDALNQIVASVNSATEVQRGLTETMSKVLKREEEYSTKLDSVIKTIGDIGAVNQAQLKEQFDEPKEPKKLEGTGETTADDDATPSDGELKEKVPGKQTLGHGDEKPGAAGMAGGSSSGGDNTEKSKRIIQVVKTVKAPAAPTTAAPEVSKDIKKSMITSILTGKIRAGDVMDNKGVYS